MASHFLKFVRSVAEGALSSRASEYGFDFFLTFVIGLKEMHNICCLVYNREDPDQVRRMKELIEVCIDEAARLGYGEYRTHIGRQNPYILVLLKG